MASQTARLPTLDHIVILVSYNTLENLTSYLQDLFTVAPGGQHSNGLTSNKLVLFEDGVYIEFIAFYDHIDPMQRQNHRWGSLRENSIIDWAFTYPPENDFNAIRDRVSGTNTRITYEEPAEWSRKRNDGIVLEWTLSTPISCPPGSQIPPGRLPFWCLDTTPRSLRVPYAEMPHLVQHPSNVRGIASLESTVGTEEVTRLAKAYEAMCGDSVASGNQVWHYRVPEGSQFGIVSLRGAPGEAPIILTLKGPISRIVEPLPGLEFKIEP